MLYCMQIFGVYDVGVVFIFKGGYFFIRMMVFRKQYDIINWFAGFDGGVWMFILNFDGLCCIRVKLFNDLICFIFFCCFNFVFLMVCVSVSILVWIVFVDVIRQ